MASLEKESRIPIAVISDGKPGHENQSLGIAEHIPNSDIILLRHKLKEGLTELWFRILVRFSVRPSAHPRRYLRYAFGEAEIDRLVNHSPKAIIASGTLSAAPCILAGALTGAKTCVCMRPSLIPLSMFDLAIVPEHDNPGDDPKIVRTLAAPNRVSLDHLSMEADKWWDEFPPGDRVISWIIGGPSSSADFDGNHVLDGLLGTLVWARNHGWHVWLSTARRTPVSLEDAISKIARSYPALTWTLLWHRDKRNPLYAMFHRSRLAIVTSDSVSMIAEAASAGKGPLVYQSSVSAGEKRKQSKQDRMIDVLINAGFGSLAQNPDIIADELQKMLESEIEFPRLRDTEIASGRLLTLIGRDRSM